VEESTTGLMMVVDKYRRYASNDSNGLYRMIYLLPFCLVGFQELHIWIGDETKRASGISN
jgi:hypothetical protein